MHKHLDSSAADCIFNLANMAYLSKYASLALASIIGTSTIWMRHMIKNAVPRWRLAGSCPLCPVGIAPRWSRHHWECHIAFLKHVTTRHVILCLLARLNTHPAGYSAPWRCTYFWINIVIYTARSLQALCTAGSVTADHLNHLPHPHVVDITTLAFKFCSD